MDDIKTVKVKQLGENGWLLSIRLKFLWMWITGTCDRIKVLKMSDDLPKRITLIWMNASLINATLWMQTKFSNELVL